MQLQVIYDSVNIYCCGLFLLKRSFFSYNAQPKDCQVIGHALGY